MAAPVLSVVELVSPLSLTECRRLLRSEMDGPFAFRGKRPLIGWSWGTNWSVLKRIRGRNSFQTMLWATMTERNGQTHIYCRLHVSPFVVLFMAIWFGIFAHGLYFAPPHPVSSRVLLMAMILFGIGLVSLGLYLARGERQFLIDFLCETLKAKATT